MATIKLHETTTATPEQFLAALTDFGPGRQEIFGNSDKDNLEVHGQGADWADVTEGTGSIWERLHYDWSDPNRIVIEDTDSNTWGGSSGYTYTLHRYDDGTTDIDAVIVREGKNLKGRFLGLVFATVGKRVFAKSFASTVKAIEARSEAPATAAEPRGERVPSLVA
jgi:hypothetical protein